MSDADSTALSHFLRQQSTPGNAHGYTDYRRMLDAEKLDVAAVCNDNGERAAAIPLVWNGNYTSSRKNRWLSIVLTWRASKPPLPSRA